MDTTNFLKTLSQSKSGIITKTTNFLRVKSPQSIHEPFEEIPRSLTQLLLKYSPKNSQKIATEMLNQKMMQKLSTITRVLQTIPRGAIAKWRNYTQTSRSPEIETKYCLSIPVKLRTKFIKPQTSRQTVVYLSPHMQVKKCKDNGPTRSNTIKKLESVVKLVKSLRKVSSRFYHSGLLNIKIYKIHRDFLRKVNNSILIKKLTSYFITLKNISKTIRNLSMHTNQCISITPKLKNSENLSVIQETAFNLMPVRSGFNPLPLNSRYSNNEISDSQIVTFELSPNQSLVLPNIFIGKFLEREGIETNLLDDSQKNILLEYSERESLEDFKFTDMLDNSILKLEDKYSSSSREISPILRENNKRVQDFYQEKIIQGLTSTSTMCIIKTENLRRKVNSILSREDIIHEIQFCEKSDSVNTSKNYKPIRIEVGVKRIIESSRNQKIINEKNNKSTRKDKLVVRTSSIIERKIKDAKIMCRTVENVWKRNIFAFRSSYN